MFHTQLSRQLVRKITRLHILILLLFTGQVFADIYADPRSNASFYIDMYGLVDVSISPLAQRAHSIFNRIRQVAEDPVGINPGLKIIKSKGKPWAIALPDGYVILSMAALDVCYGNVDKSVGDARLAFVLGHELAHLTAKDFWHQNIYLSLSSGEKNNFDLENIRRAFNIDDSEKLKDWRDVVRKKELHADDKGFTYASLANFQTNLLFSKGSDRDAFLNTWIKQTRSIDDGLHFSASNRTAFLQNRFRQMTSKMEYFMSGVRLSHFGQFEDAMHFFEKFQRAFPAHEVLNNMGYVQIQLARKLMPNALRYRYWLPIYLENVPNLVLLTRTFDSELPPQSRRHLENAVSYLQKSVKMQLNKIGSRVNLAAAYLYLGEYHKARASIEDARELDPDSAVVREIRAIIIYEQEKDIDMWPTAVKILKTIPKSDFPSVLFNLARLYDNRGRYEQAKTYWSKLANSKITIPKPIYLIACHKVKKSSTCRKNVNYQPSIPPIKTRLSFGESLHTKKAKKVLKDWQHRHEEIGPLPVDLFLSENLDTYLAVDHKITLIVVKKHSKRSTKQLLQCCGRPLSKQSLGQAELWSYGANWTALIENSKVREYWIKGSN